VVATLNMVSDVVKACLFIYFFYWISDTFFDDISYLWPVLMVAKEELEKGYWSKLGAVGEGCIFPFLGGCMNVKLEVAEMSGVCSSSLFGSLEEPWGGCNWWLFAFGDDISYGVG